MKRIDVIRDILELDGISDVDKVVACKGVLKLVRKSVVKSVASSSKALCNAFIWEGTEEGHLFWNRIFTALERVGK